MRPADARRSRRDERILSLRAAGLTQRTIAKTLALSPPTVSRSLARADRAAQARMNDRAVEFLVSADERLEGIVERALVNHAAAEKASGLGRAPTKYLALALDALAAQARLLGADVTRVEVASRVPTPEEPALDLSALTGTELDTLERILARATGATVVDTADEAGDDIELMPEDAPRSIVAMHPDASEPGPGSPDEDAAEADEGARPGAEALLPQAAPDPAPVPTEAPSTLPALLAAPPPRPRPVFCFPSPFSDAARRP